MCFFQSDKKLIEKSGLFDPQYYLDSNPDLKILSINPLEHFVMSGWREGRNPSARFNTKFYLRNYHESIPEDQNPLIHYIKKGQKEGKLALPDKDQPARFESFTPVFKKKRFLSRRNLQFGIAYIKSYGLVSFINKVFSKLFQIPFFFGRGKSSPVKMLEESQNAVLLKAKVHDIQPNDIIVSIVIPCKNAGDEFQFLLKMLQAQKGFKHIELVIVDSGSTDQTLEIAHRYNAKV
ncbi:MAG: glycosyltransferase, partial [Chloroflexi bacterium]|nr:glycosyltransferase [Chloroflexota bacterium]